MSTKKNGHSDLYTGSPLLLPVAPPPLESDPDAQSRGVPSTVAFVSPPMTIIAQVPRFGWPREGIKSPTAQIPRYSAASEPGPMSYRDGDHASGKHLDILM